MDRLNFNPIYRFAAKYCPSYLCLICRWRSPLDRLGSLGKFNIYCCGQCGDLCFSRNYFNC